ncbi:MAG: hypothetical protein MMC33_010012 [Icmadophila ericetorum]|nr:hypothetical protein [Icmadophila ericetorum]
MNDSGDATNTASAEPKTSSVTNTDSFRAWAENVSRQGHPSEAQLLEKTQPWKKFYEAKKRTAPTKGEFFVTRSYDEDLSESGMGC